LKIAENELAEFRSLYNAATAIVSNLTFEDVITSIVHQIIGVLNSAGCTIELWHPDRNELEVLIDHSVKFTEEADKPGKIYDLSEFPETLNVLETGLPLQIQIDDPTADKAEVTAMRQMGVFSLLMVPLIVKDKVIGLLEIFEDVEARQYKPDEIRLAQSLASQGAIAFENSHLYQQAQNEIEKRKQAERALQENKELFDSFMKYLPALAFMKDKNGRYVYLNQAYETLYGIDPKDRIGKTDDELFPPDVAEQIKANDRYVMTEGIVYQDFENVEFNGTVYHHLASKFPIFKKGKATIMAGIAFDITKRVNAEKENKRLEEQLQRSQRMESLGLLAGGVAHDLNNVLSGTVSYPELLLMDLPENSPLRKPIQTIQQSGQKAAEIVQDLLTLTRRGVMHNEVLNLNQIVTEYLNSSEHEKLVSYHPSVSINADLEPALLNILGSPIHLKKSIMNLVSNASEAQPKGGVIRIATENRYIDRPIKGYEDVQEGDYALLTVEDKGEGIASDDLKRIFEPFYTKKAMGRSGTGLGMAVVWGAVQDHKGYINVQSTEGKGTRFELFIPATRDRIVEENEKISIGEYSGNRESILVVDDVAEQREIASRMLTKLGYSVTAVESGEKALKYLESNSVDLVVLDMIMAPGMDGLATYKKIIEMHPRQKAIIASGYSETSRVKEAQKLGAGQYIKKPYTLEKIGLAIKDVLS